MNSQSPARQLIAAAFFVAALFVAMNRVVEEAPLSDWWLAIVLFVLGVAFLLLDRYGFRLNAPAPEFDLPDDDYSRTLPVGGVRTYRISEIAPVSPETPAPAAPAESAPASPETPTRLHTMTIRPEREELDADEPPSREHPIPDTQDARPAAVGFDMSPTRNEGVASPEERLEDAANREAAPGHQYRSEEDAAKALHPEAGTTEAIHSEVSDKQPSQEIPLEVAQDAGEPADPPSFVARTEYANQDATATKEPPQAPGQETAEIATPHDEPVKESVVEKTASPQQPYETDNMGTLTPDEVDRVVSDQPSETEAKSTEPASPEIAAQETEVVPVVGSGDDLTVIDGIGAKINAALVAAGVDSFHKLANTSESRLREILDAAGVRIVGSSIHTWAHQAAYAARGDWEGLRHWVEQNRSAGEGD